LVLQLLAVVVAVVRLAQLALAEALAVVAVLAQQTLLAELVLQDKEIMVVLVMGKVLIGLLAEEVVLVR
jgi:hypothetical protein